MAAMSIVPVTGVPAPGTHVGLPVMFKVAAVSVTSVGSSSQVPDVPRGAPRPMTASGPTYKAPLPDVSMSPPLPPAKPPRTKACP